MVHDWHPADARARVRIDWMVWAYILPNCILILIEMCSAFGAFVHFLELITRILPDIRNENVHNEYYYVKETLVSFFCFVLIFANWNSFRYVFDETWFVPVFKWYKNHFNIFRQKQTHSHKYNITFLSRHILMNTKTKQKTVWKLTDNIQT